MTVSELIKVLSTLDPETPVMGRGYEDGFDAITEAKTYLVCAKKGEWYNGDYEIYDDDYVDNSFVGAPFTALVVR